MAYDSIEPLDPAGAILKGFAGSKSEGGNPSSGNSSNWLNQKKNMLHWFNLFGKKKNG